MSDILVSFGTDADLAKDFLNVLQDHGYRHATDCVSGILQNMSEGKETGVVIDQKARSVRYGTMDYFHVAAPYWTLPCLYLSPPKPKEQKADSDNEW